MQRLSAAKACFLSESTGNMPGPELLIKLLDQVILGFHVTYSYSEIITFPSEVLVAFDKRSYRTMTFDNVLARQDSSFCNRARFEFPSFSVA